MKQLYLKNVCTLTHNEDNCTGCGTCLDVCPHNVFEPHASKVRIANLDACMECGACMGNCPFGAIDVKKGVGCAAAVIYGLLHRTEPSCDCGE